MNPEQEIELVLRVLSTRPTDEEIFHLEHEDVNPRKVEQEPEEKPEEEPVPLPVPVGAALSSLTARSVSFKKFRTHETTSSAPQRNGRLDSIRRRREIPNFNFVLSLPEDVFAV
jgi:hypothetical protein